MSKAIARAGNLYATGKSVEIQILMSEHPEWEYLGYFNGKHRYTTNGIMIDVSDEIERRIFG